MRNGTGNPPFHQRFSVWLCPVDGPSGILLQESLPHTLFLLPRLLGGFFIAFFRPFFGVLSVSLFLSSKLHLEATNHKPRLTCPNVPHCQFAPTMTLIIHFPLGKIPDAPPKESVIFLHRRMWVVVLNGPMCKKNTGSKTLLPQSCPRADFQQNQCGITMT